MEIPWRQWGGESSLEGCAVRDQILV